MASDARLLVGPETDVGSARSSAAAAELASALGTALLYGTGLPPVDPSRRSYRIAQATVIVVTVVMAATTFLLRRDPIFDEESTHDQLTAQFSGASW